MTYKSSKSTLCSCFQPSSSDTKHELGVVAYPCGPALGRWRQEHQEFRVILNYIEFEDSLDCICSTLCQQTHTYTHQTKTWQGRLAYGYAGKVQGFSNLIQYPSSFRSITGNLDLSFSLLALQWCRSIPKEQF